MDTIASVALELRDNQREQHPTELPLPTGAELPLTSRGFIWRVVCGRFRWWTLAIFLSEGFHAASGRSCRRS